MISSVTVDPPTVGRSNANTPATNEAEPYSAKRDSYLVRYSGAKGAQTADGHEDEPRMDGYTSANFVPSRAHPCSAMPKLAFSMTSTATSLTWASRLTRTDCCVRSQDV